MTAAVVLTWVTAGLAAMGSVLVLVFVGAAHSTFRDELQRQMDTDRRFSDLGLTVDELITGIQVSLVITLIWSLAALVLAVLAFRRIGWARILLVVSAAISALLSLLMILSIVSVLTLVPSVAVVVLLLTGRANAWYSTSAPGGSPPQPPRGAW